MAAKGSRVRSFLIFSLVPSNPNPSKSYLYFMKYFNPDFKDEIRDIHIHSEELKAGLSEEKK